MAKRKYELDEKKIERWIRAGRGKGKDPDYKPWFTIQDVPSSGRVHRILGWKTNRQHSFLSDLECNYFYHLEWANDVIDIREQFPLLPLGETLSLAKSLSISHPKFKSTYQPLSSDFLITESPPI